MIKVLDVSGLRSGTMDALDHAIARSGANAYVVYASSEDADMRYLSGFKTSDPFIYLKRPRRRGVIIVSQMEHTRAVRESPAAVMTRVQAGLVEILKQEKDPWRATAKMIAGQVQGTILVPPRFPLALARALQDSVDVVVDKDCLESMRAKKTRVQMAEIRNVQKATESAIDAGISLIRRSTGEKGTLFSGGKPLTSEIVRAVMHNCLAGHGCIAKDTIVSCGEDTAIPHALGSGALKAHQPIVLDLFPQNERSGYFSDMTRTVSKGKPDPAVMDMYDAVCDAQALAERHVCAGASGAGIHQMVVDLFKERGYGSTNSGFVHNLGHGIGLAVHELPSLGPSGTELASGNVITIEPGLYCPGTGGVRLEDIGAVTKKGFSRFTRYPTELVL
jgi:Xaa-Pro aminopeptidase